MVGGFCCYFGLDKIKSFRCTSPHGLGWHEDDTLLFWNSSFRLRAPRMAITGMSGPLSAVAVWCSVFVLSEHVYVPHEENDRLFTSYSHRGSVRLSYVCSEGDFAPLSISNNITSLVICVLRELAGTKRRSSMRDSRRILVLRLCVPNWSSLWILYIYIYIYIYYTYTLFGF